MLAALITTWGVFGLVCTVATAQDAQVRADLFAIERESHQHWLRGDTRELDALMVETYHFVVMNGAVETKADVTGRSSSPDRPRPLRVESLEVEPERLMLHGDTAVVIALMRIKASAAGRALPERMRVLSVFVRARSGARWQLAARSIMPIMGPPAPAADRP